MRLRLYTLALAVVLGCSGGEGGGGPTPEPDPDPDPPELPELPPLPLVIGDTISGFVPEGSRASWWHVATEAGDLAFFLAADSGAGWLQATVVRSGEVTVVHAVAGQHGTLLNNRSGRLAWQAGDSLVVRVNPHSGTPLRYRFLAYPIDRRPEHSSEAYEPDSLRITERLENSADIDEFLITTSVPLELVGFLRTPATSTAGIAALYVNPASFDAVSSAPQYGSIEQSATRTVSVPAGNWRIEVRGVSGPPEPYEFIVRRVRRAPEAAPQEHPAGRSTFGESLDHIGDIDEYSIVGPPGQYANLRLSVPIGQPRQLQLSTYGDGVVERRAAIWPGRPNSSTGRVLFPPSGRIGLRVELPSPTREAVGSYEVTQDLLHPAPENGSLLVAGDSVIAESIEREGDVDTFQFTLAAPAALNFFLRRTMNTPGTLQLDVWPGSDTASTTRVLLYPSAAAVGTGVRALPAGAYMARVMGGDGHDEPALFTGAYRLHAYRIDSAPEMASASALIGSVLQDAIDPPGDRDTFALAGQAGDVFRLRFITPAGGGASPIVASFLNRAPGAAPPWQGAAGVPLLTADLGVIPPIEMGVDGPHRIEVKSTHEGLIVVGPEGPYAIAVEPVSTAPESNPAVLGVNASVSEALDPGDIDEYTISGSPGQELVIQFASTIGSGGMMASGPCAEFLDPGSTDRRGGLSAFTGGAYSSPIVAGPTGNLRVRVWLVRMSCPTLPSGRYGAQGSGTYTLSVRPVDPAPETASAQLAVGDTVWTESLEFPWDVDVFTFSGTAGQEIVPSLQEGAGSEFSTHLRLRVIEPGGAVVAELRSQGIPVWQRGDAAALPVTGTYTVRVETQDRRQGVGGYRFTL